MVYRGAMTASASRSVRSVPQTGVAASEVRLDRLFRESVASMRAHLEATARAFDLTPTQALALRALGEPQPMRSLAGRMRCDASYVTAIADHFEKRGLAERRPDPADRRVKTLLLTDRGREVRGRLVARLVGASPLTRALSEVAPDERDLVAAVLERIAAIASRDGELDAACPGCP